MKKLLRKISIAFSFLPMLVAVGCTSASTPPGVIPEDYTDFTVSYVSEEVDGDDVLTTVHVNNTGYGYLSSFYVIDREPELYYFNSSEGFDTPFYTAVIPPYSERNVVLRAYRSLTNKDNLEFKGKAYQGGGASSIKGEPSLSHSYGTRYSITGIEIMGSLMMKRPTTLYYGVIIEVKYDGQTYYFACDEDHGFGFSTAFELDTSKVTSVQVRGQISSDKPTSSSEIIVGLLIILVALILFSLIFGVPIFLAIFIPIMIVRKKRRNALNN